MYKGGQKLSYRASAEAHLSIILSNTEYYERRAAVALCIFTSTFLLTALEKDSAVMMIPEFYSLYRHRHMKTMNCTSMKSDDRI